MNLYTTTEAATEIGCHRYTVSRAAARLGVGTKKGAILLFSPAELKRLKAEIREAPGNPNFVPGNYLGRPPKKSKKSPKSTR